MLVLRNWRFIIHDTWNSMYRGPIRTYLLQFLVLAWRQSRQSAPVLLKRCPCLSYERLHKPGCFCDWWRQWELHVTFEVSRTQQSRHCFKWRKWWAGLLEVGCIRFYKMQTRSECVCMCVYVCVCVCVCLSICLSVCLTFPFCQHPVAVQCRVAPSPSRPNGTPFDLANQACRKILIRLWKASTKELNLIGLNEQNEFQTNLWSWQNSGMYTIAFSVWSFSVYCRATPSYSKPNGTPFDLANQVCLQTEVFVFCSFTVNCGDVAQW